MFSSLLSFFFYGLLSFFIFPSLGNAKQIPDCNCEKILEKRKCSNPDCIPICELEYAFDETGKFIADKCFEKMVKEEDFTQEESFDVEREKVSELEDIMDDVQDIVEKNEEVLQKTCPGCSLEGKAKADLVSITEEEDCSKYIHTREYKGWKIMKDECERMEDEGGINDAQTKRLCEENEKKDDKYEICCAGEYLFDEEGKLKKYLHTAGTKEELKPGQTCGDDEANKILERIGSYVEGIMRGNSKKFSKKIHNACPDGCSFDMAYFTLIDRNTCSGKLDLQVACAHKADRKGFPISLPIYDIEVDYKEEIKCQ